MKAKTRVTAVAVAALLALTGAASLAPAGQAQAGPRPAADDWAELQGILSGIQGRATAPIGNVTTPKYTAGMSSRAGSLASTRTSYPSGRTSSTT